MPHLYAKSSPRLSLPAHTDAVVQAGVALFGAPSGPLTRLGTRYLHFFGLQQPDSEHFLRTLHVALWLHDLGKANDEFQAAIAYGWAQAIRHEHLSAMLLSSGALRDWLYHGVDAEVVMAAIAAHHLKAAESDFGMPLVEGPLQVRVPMGHEDVAALLDGARATANLPPAPKLGDVVLGRDDLDTLRWDIRQASNTLKRAVRRDERRARFLAAVRAALIAADAAGSAMLRAELNIATWIGECFEHNPLSPGEVQSRVLEPRIKEIMSRTGQPFSWHEFQNCWHSWKLRPVAGPLWIGQDIGRSALGAGASRHR